MDFLRLNLNAALGFGFALIALIVVFAIVQAKIVKEYKKYATWGFLALFAVLVFSAVVTMTSQVAVNNIPRTTIDRGYIDKSQQNYENRVSDTSSTKGR